MSHPMNTDTPFQPSPSSPVLLVVESPVKARTISGFLGDGWIVRATGGDREGELIVAIEAAKPRGRRP